MVSRSWLLEEFSHHYEEKDAIGKRYRRQDAIGTPFCITVDGEFLVLAQVEVGAAVDAFHFLETEGHEEFDVGGGIGYLRPETAQGIFVNYLNVQKTGRMRIPCLGEALVESVALGFDFSHTRACGQELLAVESLRYSCTPQSGKHRAMSTLSTTR